MLLRIPEALVVFGESAALDSSVRQHSARRGAKTSPPKETSIGRVSEVVITQGNILPIVDRACETTALHFESKSSACAVGALWSKSL